MLKRAEKLKLHNCIREIDIEVHEIGSLYVQIDLSFSLPLTYSGRLLLWLVLYITSEAAKTNRHNCPLIDARKFFISTLI